ncbi:MAG: IS1634 family transposase [Bacteroidetes bacterium]|nr:IS1634 family transposase [Bacteroidota bacterium]
MFIDDSTYARNGKTYRRVLLRNSYRVDGKVRHDTLANLSSCNDDEIDLIKFAIKHKQKIKAVVSTSASIAQNINTKQGLAVGSVWVFTQVAKKLGITKALGTNREAKLSLWLVMAALIGQGSRLSAVRLAQRHAVCDVLKLDAFNEDDLYTSMDWLASHQQAIEKKLFTHRYGDTGHTPTLYLYDVTSSYLEGTHNELASFGNNKDKKKGKMQIVIGLLTDDTGLPVTVDVFKGNTQDPKTVENQIIALSRRFGVKKVTFVGDRGMVKSGQIEALHGEHFRYITAITKPQIQKLIREGTLCLSLFDTTLYEVTLYDDDDPNTPLRYILRRNPIRARALEATRESKLTVLHTMIDQKNIYLQEHPRAQVNVAHREVETKAKKLKIDGWTTIERGSENRVLSLKKDAAKREEEAELDGCYVIKSDVPVNEASTTTIHRRYKDLKEVEWAFRTMKTTLLELRGIYVRKEIRTRAHVFIIMLAYLIAYELRRQWREIEMTVEEGIDELSSISTVIVEVAGITCQSIPEPRSYGQELLTKLNITLPDAIPHRNVEICPRKKIKDVRRQQ